MNRCTHLLAATLLFTACQPSSEDHAETTELPAQQTSQVVFDEPDSGGFFGAGLVEDATSLGSDFTVVACVGATPEEQNNLEHPRVIRGQVVSPFGRIASWSPVDLLIPSAFAVPVEGENTVAEVDVQLMTLQPDGRPSKVLSKTTSDALGRFCFKLPDGADYGAMLGLVATYGDESLRAVVLSRGHGNLSLTSDVVLSLYLQKHALDLPNARARLINLHTLADSAVDLLEPVTLEDDDNLITGRQKIKEHLLKDLRFSASFAK